MGLVKIILYLILSVLIFSSIYFSSYIKIINIQLKTIENKISEKKLEKLYKLIILEKKRNLENMKSTQTITNVLRIQTIREFYTANKKNFNKKLWRIEVLTWNCFSYLYLTNEDIKKIYLYQRIYRIPNQLTVQKAYVKIYEYSNFYFKKNINKLTDKELERLYTMRYNAPQKLDQ